MKVFVGKTKKRILFHYMLGLPIGGSDNSLFYHILKLDKTKFEPIVVFNQHSFQKDVLDRMGIKTILVPLIDLNKNSAPITDKQKKKSNFIVNFLRVKIGREFKAVYKAIPEILKVNKLISQIQIDQLHTNFNLARSRAAIISAIIHRVPVIVHNRNLAYPLYIDRQLSKCVKKIICVSDFIKQKYVENGIPEEKCTVIYNGVDLDKFRPMESDDYSGKVIVTTIGRLEKWKGQDVLIRTIPFVLKKIPSAEFWIIGDGPEMENLIHLTKELNIERNLKFWGKIDNVNEYLFKSHIFVHTSIDPEPFGRVIIEAMACGLPVISTNIGGPLEIITNNQNGILIPPRNEDLLAQKIIYLIENQEYRSNIVKQSLETVVKYFDIRDTTIKIEKLYT